MQTVKARASLELRPRADLSPVHLSALLSELVEGQPELTLRYPLIA